MPLSQMGLAENGSPEGAPSLSLRSLQGQGGVFDFPRSDSSAPLKPGFGGWPTPAPSPESTPEGAPSLSLRFLQGQGGGF